ncbi:MAG: hypothetical protein QOD83_2460 [Solirubrobacteraceae bacterium]|nr:hypothetical protein [Solirubrobacteraceae bacterium]
MSRSWRNEDGFSMIVVLGVMMIGALIAVASFTLTIGDAPQSRSSNNAKQAYAAAEAGLHYYLFHLAQDNQYWTKCTNVAPPGPGQPNPVNQAWNGTGQDPRVWRSLPRTSARYTIELLAVTGAAACEATRASLTMIDAGTGTMRIRTTGEAGGRTRSLIATLRRRSFIDYLYFTDYETGDPVTYSGQTNINWAQQNCVRYRAQRPSGCSAITFVANGSFNDKINGPFHTNDDILVCGTPTFGRRSTDVIEVSGPAPGYATNCAGSAPNFLGTWQTAAKTLAMPPSNASLAQMTDAQYKFTGTTTLRLNGNTITVTNNGTTVAKAWPANGLIYVKSGACGSNQAPPLQAYSEPQGCANVYVSGTYAGNLTIASEKDIVIRPPTSSSNGNVIRSGDVMLGLIANNFVRVYHKVSRSDSTSMTSCTNTNSSSSPLMNTVTIEAAILSLSHSFIADNHACGNQLGALKIVGAIAQRFRGPVGTFGSVSTGFTKDYTYDDRLRYREPPYFLEPVATAWRVVRQSEQVPAR